MAQTNKHINNSSHYPIFVCHISVINKAVVGFYDDKNINCAKEFIFESIKCKIRHDLHCVFIADKVGHAIHQAYDNVLMIDTILNGLTVENIREKDTTQATIKLLFLKSIELGELYYVIDDENYLNNIKTVVKDYKATFFKPISSDEAYEILKNIRKSRDKERGMKVTD